MPGCIDFVLDSMLRMARQTRTRLTGQSSSGLLLNLPGSLSIILNNCCGTDNAINGKFHWRYVRRAGPTSSMIMH